MAPIIDTDDPRATKILDAAGVIYRLGIDVSAAPIVHTDSDNAWVIKGVNYRGKVVPVRLSRELLPAMNLGQMAAHSKKAMRSNEFYTPDAPLIYAITKRAMEQNDSEVREFLRKSFFGQWLNTLSVVRYQPKGKSDQIIHNPGLPTQYSNRLNFVSPDEWTKGSARAKDYKVLLGANSPDEVDEVFGWTTGKRSYLWKVNHKPASVDERVVRLDADSVRFYLNCSRNPQFAFASFGVSLPQKILEHHK